MINEYLNQKIQLIKIQEKDFTILSKEMNKKGILILILQKKNLINIIFFSLMKVIKDALYE